jgi:nucleotide-binding universal stress UspA family protein
MIAIATSRGSTGFAALRAGLNRVVVRERGARVACVTVVKPVPALGTSTDGGNAAQLRLEHLKALRAFAEPLRLAPEHVSMHVLESNDPAEALIHYARVNRVDHVVIGAPPPDISAVSRASTVAMRVAVGVPCTVTLVRDDNGPVPDAAGGLS